MKWSLCILVTMYYAVANGQPIEPTYPTFGQCNQTIISKIKDYRKTAGTAQDILETLEDGKTYLIARHSYKALLTTVKCVTLDFTKGGMTVHLILKNGAPPINVTYIVDKGQDEVLQGRIPGLEVPESKWIWYPIYFDQGVYVNYVCSNAEGVRKSPVANIILSKSNKNMFNSIKVTNLNSMLLEWGFDMDLYYGEDCF